MTYTHSPATRHSSLATALFSLLLYLLMSLLPYSASAQVAVGTPPFGSFSGGPEIINNANLNVHWTIPVLHKPGRGSNFTYDLTYDSSVWYPVGSSGSQSWQPVANWGWTSSTAAVSGSLYYAVLTAHFCPYFIGRVIAYHGATYIRSNWTFYDDLGTPHHFSGQTQVSYSNDPSCTAPPPVNLNTTVNDGSGYNLQASGGSGTVYDTKGTQIGPPINAFAGPGTRTDRNGNIVSIDNSGNITDTLGAVALAVSGTGTPASPITFTYAAPSGASPSYTMKYTTYSVQTSFSCSGITEYGANGTTTANLVSEIDLPDGSKYSFSYEPTPGHSGFVTGRLASVTLPTGGTISYSYSGGSNGTVCADGSTATLTRTTPDGTWTYAHSESGTAWSTLITDPQNNQTNMNFQGIYETERQVYQGSTSGTLLRQWFTCYNGAASPCNGSAITLPITRRTVTDQYGSSGLQCKHDYFYNSVGGPTEQDDYDYGSGSPGALLRKTLFTYASLGNITAFRQTVTVCNGAGSSSSCAGPSGGNTGTVIAQTNYNYDEPNTLTATSGIAQHTSVSGSRGNLTSINYPVSSLTSHFTYYDTGSTNTSQDVNSATTTYNYSSASCQMAFPTSISEPLNMSRSMAWNCTGGVLTSVTDENSQVTSTAYSDPYFWRPASKSFPDTGQTSWTYNSPTSITTTRKMNSSQNIVTTQLLDGLGRASQSQLNSDTEGVDYSVLTYDALGRPYQAYNLTRCSPPTTNCGEATWGYTTTGYDALSRTKSVTLQDGSVVSASYANNTITTTDPAGKKRTTTDDSLGRVTQVNEDPAGLNYATTYSYDALSNLTNVTQNGSRQRTFAYDAMSRLTSESNPETGTTTYRYDSDSNCSSPNSSSGDLISRTDARNIRTCLQYDALHRLTQKNYSDGTPTAFFSWDGSGRWGYNQTNTTGRLGEEWTGTSCCASGGAEIFSYDPMGRVTYNNQYTTSMGNVALNYSYDFAGDMTSYANGVGVTFTQSFDAAGRPTGLTSSLVDGNHPATLATVDSSVGYYPPGAVRKMTFGNGLTQATEVEPRLQPCQINLNSSGSLLTGCGVTPPSGTIQDFHYIFGGWGTTNNDDVTEWIATGQQSFDRTFSYDGVNRLVTLNQNSGTANNCSSTFGLSWNYDAWGNRTDQNVTSGTCNTFHASVNSNNQFFGSPFQYDAAGNMTNDGNHTYFYDAESRLIQVDGALGNCSAATACYLYDALGHRTVRQTPSNNLLSFIHDLSGNMVAGWCAPCGGWTGWDIGYVYFNGQVTAEYANSTTYFIHPDHLGSTHLLTGLNQSVVQAVDYLPFGELNSSNSWDTWDFFTGLERDSETNLDHTQFRQYSSQLGRWMTPDPAGLAAVDPTNPKSWNRYVYVMNNPLSAVDPSGLYLIVIGGCYYDAVDFYVDYQYQSTDYTFLGCNRSSAGLVGSGGSGGGGGGIISRISNRLKILAKNLPCVAALPLMANSWSNGGGSTSIGGSGSFTAAVPTGGIDVNVSAMANADAWGNVSLTVTGGSNDLPPLGGQAAVGAGASWGVSVSTSNGNVAQLNGESLGGWAALGPVSFQASRSANNGPVSSGMTLGQGIGFQYAGANLFKTKTLARTNCSGAAIEFILSFF